MDIENKEIMYLEELIEILEILEKYDKLEDIKNDIYIRKKIYKEQLELYETNS